MNELYVKKLKITIVLWHGTMEKMSAKYRACAYQFIHTRPHDPIVEMSEFYLGLEGYCDRLNHLQVGSLNAASLIECHPGY